MIIQVSGLSLRLAPMGGIAKAQPLSHFILLNQESRWRPARALGSRGWTAQAGPAGLGKVPQEYPGWDAPFKFALLSFPQIFISLQPLPRAFLEKLSFNKERAVSRRNIIVFSVVQLCWTLCDLIDCSRPGFPILRYLPEFVQIHVH